MMFSLSYVGEGGSKSAEGGPYPLAELDQGVQIKGVQIRWDTPGLSCWFWWSQGNVEFIAQNRCIF